MFNMNFDSEMRISAIIPVHNEEGNVIAVYQELKEILQKITLDFEIIFIDDGSQDATLSQLLSLKPKEENLSIIKFARNYGKSAALTAGFAHVKGDSVITLDGDGQDDPNNIPNLVKALTEESDVVCGWRVNRKDRYLKKLYSKVYNFLNRRINRINVHDSNCMLRVYRKEVISGLILPKGAHRYIPIILSKRGYRITEIEVIHRSRLTGKSSYGFKRLFSGFLDLFRFRSLDKNIQPVHIVEKKYGFD